MLPTYDVYIAETSGDCLENDLLKRFIVTYLTQDDLDKLKMVLTNIPQLRPFWGKQAINTLQSIISIFYMKLQKTKEKSLF